MNGRHVTASWVCAVLVGAGALLPQGGAGAATPWAVAVGSSGAQAQSRGLPGTPGGVTASCAGTVLNPKAVVSWSAVTQAGSYSVLESTTSSTSGFAAVASVTTLTWTSATLGTGTFWFRVTASIGTNWTGPQSASSAGITVLLGISCT